MKFSYTLKDLIEMLNPLQVLGQTHTEITQISSLLEARQGHISFLGNSKYQKDVKHCKASAILLPSDLFLTPGEDQCFLTFANPSYALAVLCQNIESRHSPKQDLGVHPNASIGEKVRMGRNVSIGANVVVEPNAIIGNDVIVMPGCYIGHSAKIGNNSVLQPCAKVMAFCEIGNRVNLFPGAVVGSDGYGYETVQGIHEKVPQIGNVVIDDDVDIGSNTTIDRARFGSTRIGAGTKIDNLVQIGHNVVIGKGCLIVAQTGIAGSATIGNYVTIGGQVGIVGHITIPDRVMIAGQSGVTGYHKKLGKILRGTPAESIKEMNKFYVMRKKIPGLFARVSALEEKIDESKTER